MRANKLLSVLAIVLLLSCENEMQVRNYPSVTTNAVFDISSAGAVFGGSIIGDVSQVTDYGFVWAQQENPNILNDEFIKLGKPVSSEFKKEVTSGLQNGITYYVRAFVITGNKTVYGLPEKFVGLGSLGPVLVKISKSEGQYLDTLDLTVRNITMKQEKNTVAFGEESVGRILSIKDSVIRVTVPFLTQENYQVKVRVDARVTTALPFKYQLPVIESVTPGELFYCDTLTVTGKYFPRDTMAVKLSIGSRQVNYKRVGANKLKHAANVIYETPNTVSVAINKLKLTAKSGFTQHESKITSAAVTAKPGEVVVFTGINLPTCDLKVTYPDNPNTPLKIIESTRTTLKVELPVENGLCERPNVLNISPAVGGQAALTWANPIINTTNVYSGLIGETIKIKGAGFGTNPNRISVSIGRSFAGVLSVKDDEVTILVTPSETPGSELDLKVDVCTQSATFTKGFRYQPAIITDFNPKTITSLESSITVTGKGFDPTGMVYIGDELVSSIVGPWTETTQFSIPVSILLERTGTLQTQLPLKITTGGPNGLETTASVPITFNYVTPWAHKKIFDVFRYNAMPASTATHGYVGFGSTPTDGISNLFYEYDPSLNTWTKKADFPNDKLGNHTMIGTDDRVYAGVGSDNDVGGSINEWWVYNPTNDSWTRKADFPGPGRMLPISFSIGGKVYVGGGHGNSGSMLKDLYMYDPTNDTWTSKAAVPAEYELNWNHFAFKGKGYVYTRAANTSTWELKYDPIANMWSTRSITLNQFDRISREAVVLNEFVLSSSPYLGNTRFVPGTNTFTAMNRFGSRNFSGFTISGIAYLGLHIINGNSQAGYDFWSYDPSLEP